MTKCELGRQIGQISFSNYTAIFCSLTDWVFVHVFAPLTGVAEDYTNASQWATSARRFRLEPVVF